MAHRRSRRRGQPDAAVSDGAVLPGPATCGNPISRGISWLHGPNANEAGARRWGIPRVRGVLTPRDFVRTPFRLRARRGARMAQERASERLRGMPRWARSTDVRHRTKGGTTMKDSSLNRWMWLIGLVAVALLFVSFGPLWGSPPGENASGIHGGPLVQHAREPEWAQSGWSVWHSSCSCLRDPAAHGAEGSRRTAAVAQRRLRLGHPAGRRHHRRRQLRDHADPGLAQPRVRHGELPQLLLRTTSCCSSREWASWPSRRVWPSCSTARAPLPRLLGWYSILVGVVAAAGPLSFFAFLFGLPIWLLATGIVIAVKQRRGTLGGDPGRRHNTGRAPAPAVTVAA